MRKESFMNPERMDSDAAMLGTCLLAGFLYATQLYPLGLICTLMQFFQIKYYSEQYYLRSGQ